MHACSLPTRLEAGHARGRATSHDGGKAEPNFATTARPIIDETKRPPPIAHRSPAPQTRGPFCPDCRDPIYRMSARLHIRPSACPSVCAGRLVSTDPARLHVHVHVHRFGLPGVHRCSRSGSAQHARLNPCRLLVLHCPVLVCHVWLCFKCEKIDVWRELSVRSDRCTSNMCSGAILGFHISVLHACLDPGRDSRCSVTRSAAKVSTPLPSRMPTTSPVVDARFLPYDASGWLWAGRPVTMFSLTHGLPCSVAHLT